MTIFSFEEGGVCGDDTAVLLCFFFCPHVSGRCRFWLKEYFVMEREILKTQKAQVSFLQW